VKQIEKRRQVKEKNQGKSEGNKKENRKGEKREKCSIDISPLIHVTQPEDVVLPNVSLKLFHLH
jgi:hypothetical protein